MLWRSPWRTKQLPGQSGAILAAAIRVEARAGCHLATVDGALQGVGDDARVQTFGDAPAEDRAAEESEDNRQIEPTLLGRDASDVTDPMRAGCLGGSGPDQQVGRRTRRVVNPRDFRSTG